MITQIKKVHPAIWIVSLVSIVLHWFMWDMIEALTPFIGGPLIFFSAVGFLVTTIIIFIQACLKKSDHRRWLSFAILVMVIFIHFVVPFLSLKLRMDFAIKREKMEQVVAELQSGVQYEFADHNEMLKDLPQKFRGLSKGGNQIMIEKESPLTVLFYTYRGIGNYAGYVFCEADTLPDDYKRIIQSEQYSEHWWWVSGK